jgi:predicted MFS family arabinose efflux permease
MNSDMMVLGCLVLMAAGILVGVFFLLSLQRVLNLCAPENRRLEPGQVWMCLIPLFSLVWIFVVVARIADSLDQEFESRHAPPEDYGRGVGMAYCILTVVSIVPFLNLLTGPAGLVCLIIYWAKIADYSRRLEQNLSFAEGGPAQRAGEVEEPFDLSKAWPMLLILMFASAAQYLQNAGLSWFRPLLQDQWHLSVTQIGMAYTVFSFGMIAGCVLLTVVTALCGSRWGLAVSLVGVSLAVLVCGMATALPVLIAGRAMLGFFAGGFFPAAIQCLRECFPRRMRPLAIGLFISSHFLVILLASPFISFLTRTVGWRTAMSIAAVPTVIAAALCWFFGQRPKPSGGPGGISGVAVASVIMLAAGALLASPLNTFVLSWAPVFLREAGLSLSSISSLSAICMAVSAGGAILAGAAASGWAMMRNGAPPWKTRAVLLTLFGLMLSLAAAFGIYIAGWGLTVVCALIAGAFQGFLTLLYAGISDTLPTRGVSVGAAIGSLITNLSSMMAPMLFGTMMDRGSSTGFALGILAGLAAAGVLCVALLAWLIRPELSPLLSGPVPDKLVAE